METAHQRRTHYREHVEMGFDALADLYYSYWGDYFHLAMFEEGDDPADLAGAYERTHERYFAAIGGPTSQRILDVACGGGAFSAWMADHTRGHVLGVDLSRGQLARARRRLAERSRHNLSFQQHDLMKLDTLEAGSFDAAISLDAFCYLPDRRQALGGVARRLRSGARFLLVDWCRTARPTALQRELILEPFYRNWGIADLETVAGYRRAMADTGFRIVELEDLSDHVIPNWERGYRSALRAVAGPVRPGQLLKLGLKVTTHGVRVLDVAKGQFLVALLAKAAADSGILRYVSILAERRQSRVGNQSAQ
jgi:ubiquinone/menaquinone biosynthesis C-methylase UbiE